MQYSVSARSRRSRLWIEALMPSMIEQLGLTNSRKTLLISVEKSDCPGTTYNLDAIGSYVIVLAPASLKELALTLAHEMVHVRQLARGTLKSVNGIFYWCGRRYSKKTAYLDRPWEIDAFARQELILRRAVEG